MVTPNVTSFWKGYEARDDYTNASETTCFRVTDVRALGGLIPMEFLRAIGVHRNILMEAPEAHKAITARKPCVTDVQCNCHILIGRLIPNNKKCM